MEPQFLDCGNLWCFQSSVMSLLSFNGAAVLRLRKYRNTKSRNLECDSFNGAAVLRLRKSEGRT